MKITWSALAALSVCSMMTVNSATPPVTTGDDAAEFQAFLRRFEEGTGRFINGDATLWKQHVSQRDDATGGWSGRAPTDGATHHTCIPEREWYVEAAASPRRSSG